MSPEFAKPAEVARAAKARASNVAPRLFGAAPPARTSTMIVAVDPGQRAGWCARYPNGNIEAGVWHLKPNGFSNMGSAMLLLGENLTRLIERTQPGLVAFEEVRMHQGVDAAHWYGAIMGKILEVCEATKTPCRGIHYAKVKITACGKGSANKAAMVEAAKARWPNVAITDDNQADAMWIAETAAAGLG